jgi:hypothetical protein
MTVWSFEELCEIRGDMTLDEAEFRYLIVSGSAKNFRRSFPSAVKTLEFVESVISWAMQFITTDTEVASELSLLSESVLRVSKKAKNSK